LQRPNGPVGDEGVDVPGVRASLAAPLDVEPSGRTAALLRRSPLRTGHARFPGTTAQASPVDDEDSASASWLVHRRSGEVPPSAVSVEEPVEDPVLAVDLFDDVLFGQHAPNGHEPLFPLAWAARFVLDVQKEFPAGGTASALASQKPGGVLVHGRGLLLASPIGPVLGQGGVIRRGSAVDRDVPDDLRPGKLGEVGAAVAVTEHPAVLPGLVELAEVAAG